MPRISDEQVAAARQADLFAYLQANEPLSLKRDGPNWRHTEHDSLVYVTGRNYWYWNSRGKRINALDYLMEIRGYRFPDAVAALTGGEARDSPTGSTPCANARAPVKPKPFKLPYVTRCATFMFSYLQRRGIDAEVISRCFRLGLVYESRYSGEAVCVFVGRDEAGKGRFACVRGIGCDLKKDVAGSDKRYSFCYPPERPGSRHAAVFEAPVDALSHASLQKIEGWEWDGYRLSLGGTSPVALTAFLERHPEIARVTLHMDNDRAGIINARKIRALLKADPRFKRIRVSVKPPRGAKDYNDKLRLVLAQRREQPTHSRRQEAAICI